MPYKSVYWGVYRVNHIEDIGVFGLEISPDHLLIQHWHQQVEEEEGEVAVETVCLDGLLWVNQKCTTLTLNGFCTSSIQ